MRSSVINAMVVAALAIAPFTASIGVAHADWPMCSGMTTPIGIQACNQICAASPTPPSCNVAPVTVPKGSPPGPDNCAANLAPPNPSQGAYDGCETARRATGG
jgi:hypothetical protein